MIFTFECNGLVGISVTSTASDMGDFGTKFSFSGIVSMKIYLL